ncbi:hypothetical protein [Paenibacillus sp. UMB4589-SE434]|uniref:hypothetical protein n=1 Tax=Paenibacillus sp. UMB4589-SE434 TaxID=3046314 RepID=UPI00254B39F3|nr:hypothetical protein [Paenibacillus sp. UMB4589-SE434]MDK8182131.1 hypothetical protein [Paenibacillus sp. UMB4589-SE434]
MIVINGKKLAVGLLTVVLSMNLSIASAAQITKPTSKITANQNHQAQVIINPALIQQKAFEQNIPLYKDGAKLSKIEYEYVGNTTLVSDTSAKGPVLSALQPVKIIDVRDKGFGWYNPNNPLYDHWFDGPDTAEYSETRKSTATASHTFGITSEIISNNVGFTIGEEYSYTIKSTTPVPADKKLNVRVFQVHHKKELVYTGYDGKSYILEAEKPNGSYIQKNWYNK